MKSGCMRVSAVVNLVLGLVMAVLAVVLASRADGVADAVGFGVGLGVGGLTCLIIGGLLLFRGGRMLGGNPLLRTGRPATAMIKSIRDTGITLQFGAYAIFEFDLDVSDGIASTYSASCKSTVPRIAFSMVGVGKTVAVRVDPADPGNIAIDWGVVPA